MQEAVSFFVVVVACWEKDPSHTVGLRRVSSSFLGYAQIEFSKRPAVDTNC